MNHEYYKTFYHYNIKDFYTDVPILIIRVNDRKIILLTKHF